MFAEFSLVDGEHVSFCCVEVVFLSSFLIKSWIFFFFFFYGDDEQQELQALYRRQNCQRVFLFLRTRTLVLLL